MHYEATLRRLVDRIVLRPPLTDFVRKIKLSAYVASVMVSSIRRRTRISRYYDMPTLPKIRCVIEFCSGHSSPYYRDG